ncbi:protein DOG1-like 4 [Primulina tabacum]|uniref:protein DOG1-like 4 n=1 Tax=Primulina tabacum TaxID=48773 RepID=UPI003F597A2B
MSFPTGSRAHMANVLPNINREYHNFQEFFECWLVQQSQHLEELVSALKEQEQQGRGRNIPPGMRGGDDERILRPVIERVIQHYEHYYTAKERWAKLDVVAMFNPSWRSSLEDAFLWIGGWRPNMAFHLLYSKSGLQFEARLEELMRGLRSGDLGDLSTSQMERVNELQLETIQKEKEISEKQAKLQETVADSTMVELTHSATMLIREGGSALDEGRIDATLAPKEAGLGRILQRADNLRLKTLKNIIGVLSPKQGVHFLIAAAELHLRLHEWGKRRDSRNQQRREVGSSQEH